MRLLLVFILALFFTACSSVSMGYRFADWAIEDAVDDYLDLNSMQKKRLDKQVDEYFKWHRKNMLPRYAVHMEQAWSYISTDHWILEDWKRQNDELERLYYDTAAPLVPHIAQIFVEMDAEQVEHLRKAIADNNKEKYEEFEKDPKARLKKKQESNRKLFKKWAGSISEEQESKISGLTANLKFPVKSWLEKRKKQQKELLGLLEKKERKKADFEDLLDRYLKQTPTDDTKDYYAELGDFRNALRPGVLGMLKSMSEEQKRHFLKRLQKLINEIRNLSAA